MIAFEANPATYSIFLPNIRKNGLTHTINPINKALGSTAGFVGLDTSNKENLGNTSIQKHESGGDVEPSTVDMELQNNGSKKGSLLKIDVEGFEIKVLKGALGTIDAYKPLLCIESHDSGHLLEVLSIQRGRKYIILDCLGASPNYLMQVRKSSWIMRYLNHFIWPSRATVPQKNSEGQMVLEKSRNAGTLVGINAL